MPDITMCTNRECELRKTCYRAQATPGEWQSWAAFAPVRGDCERYISAPCVLKPAPHQLCVECGQPTERRGEDSMYIEDVGPLCEGCYGELY